MRNIFQKNRAFFLAAGLLLLALAVFAQVLHFEFIFLDDDFLVSRNAHIAGGLNWQTVRWALAADLWNNNDNCDYWRPVSMLSHILDIQWFGLDPGGHHLSNLIFHLFNILLLFGLLKTWTRRTGLSAFAAAIFAVHPLQTEAVAWISARKDVLSAFFVLITLWAYSAYVRKPSARRMLAVLAGTILALMSKPQTVILPALLLVLDGWPLSRWGGTPKPGGRAKIFLEKWPLFAAAAVSGFITIRILGPQAEPGGFFIKLSESLYAYAFYLFKFIVPVRLAAWYSFPGIDYFVPARPFIEILAAAVLLGGLTVFFLRQASRRPYLAAGWLWYLIGLLPVISLRMRIRAMYLPVIGLAVLLAWGMDALTRARRWPEARLWTASLVLIFGWAALSFSQTRLWQTSESLYGHTVRLDPKNSMAHCILANTFAIKKNDAEAIPHYLEAIKLNPLFFEAHNNVANSLKNTGRTEEAVSHYREAIRIKPDFGDAYLNLGIILQNSGDIGEAISYYLTAIRCNPLQPLYYYNACAALFNAGRYEESSKCYEQAVKLNPNEPAFREGLALAAAKLKPA